VLRGQRVDLVDVDVAASAAVVDLRVVFPVAHLWQLLDQRLQSIIFLDLFFQVLACVVHLLSQIPAEQQTDQVGVVLAGDDADAASDDHFVFGHHADRVFERDFQITRVGSRIKLFLYRKADRVIEGSEDVEQLLLELLAFPILELLHPHFEEVAFEVHEMVFVVRVAHAEDPVRQQVVQPGVHPLDLQVLGKLEVRVLVLSLVLRAFLGDLAHPV